VRVHEPASADAVSQELAIQSPETSSNAYYTQFSIIQEEPEQIAHSTIKDRLIAALVSVNRADSPDQPPPLPKFLYPRVGGLTFKVVLGDSGFSYVDISLEYEQYSFPSCPTPVTAIVRFNTHGCRRITALSMSICSTDNEVLEIEPLQNLTSLQMVMEMQVREYARLISTSMHHLSVFAK
jgi:hypothetical protein